ncbi:MAG: sigma 54-interacting transcriptional regulator [Spirochaetales bacterium]|nr:sigma 54-interacting transcriptional regulator [Spirochaetales bacterium]
MQLDSPDWKRKYHRTISLFFNISRHLTPGGDIKVSLEAVMDIIAEKLSLQRGMITILNREAGEIVTSVTWGFSDEERARGRYLPGEGVTGSVVETGEPIVVPDVNTEPRFLNRTGTKRKPEEGTTSFICVPVKSTREIIGTLSIEWSCTEEEELDDYLHVCTIIGTMISRAVRLHQAVHEENQKLMEENRILSEQLKEKYQPENIIGTSRPMRQVFHLIKKISKTQATVLILGESGTGKELIAQAVHYASNRADKPFIPFNCAVLPENLIESELFGHEKGAFTGAVSLREGKFELAHGGTIFLDEVGELSLNAQTKLLRVIQERQIERIGGQSQIHVDVRIIAATNKDLEKEVENGGFRADLYYRLNVFPITVPPLRERRTDIPLLADFFIQKHALLNGTRVNRISTPALDMLMSYHWPGNVRELEHCIERAVILTDEDTVHGYHLPPSLQKIGNYIPDDTGKLQRQIEILEYELIIEELKRTGGNLIACAKNLGITYRQMGIRMEKYRIDIKRYKTLKKGAG